MLLMSRSKMYIFVFTDLQVTLKMERLRCVKYNIHRGTVYKIKFMLLLYINNIYYWALLRNMSEHRLVWHA